MALSKLNHLLKTKSWPAVRHRLGHPVRVGLPSVPGPYALATGEAAAYRLRILHGLYGPGSRRVLLEAGVRRGMRVADVGCGVGLVTALLAELVGPEGHVVGLDASAAQLAQARERMPAGGTSVRFVEARATDTGLPPASFDLVYCRFLLLHLPEPERALCEMGALLKPNGILVCEDGDLTWPVSSIGPENWNSDDLDVQPRLRRPI
jgi:SAM-dependent methyltransferase